MKGNGQCNNVFAGKDMISYAYIEPVNEWQAVWPKALCSNEMS